MPQVAWRRVPQPRHRAGQRLRLDQGESHVTWYCSSPGNYRGFCEACGTPLLSRFDQTPDIYGLPLGALDDDPGIKPGAHCHVANKAPWFDITDTLPQYPDAFEGAETSLPHAVT